MNDRPAIDLVVLDVHGVVLNNPFRAFLADLARRTEQRPRDVLGRWDRELRLPAWTGGLSDDALWRGLTGTPPGAHVSVPTWAERLERTYTPGPAASHLERLRAIAPMWLLSNHRTHWLLPRLERFGMLRVFDRVLVSDALGVAKPMDEAFTPVLRAARPDRVLFLDDQPKNIRTAKRLGLNPVLVTDADSLPDAVNNAYLHREATS